MLTVTDSAFDKLAATYDTLWTNTAIGRSQREAVWRRVEPCFRPGQSLLDLGCGTGADLMHFLSRGLNVVGVDASKKMVGVASTHGTDVRQISIEELSGMSEIFDGAISNFGALNCVEDLRKASAGIGNLVRTGGYFAACVMGPTCVWEICHYLKQGDLGRAFRRWNRQGVQTSMGVKVYYPSVKQIRTAFSKHFELLSWGGIGLFVPPSYVTGLTTDAVDYLGELDGRMAHWPVFRMFADHRLLIFKRL